MEKFIKPYDKEYMRLALLKHEQTFKEQLYELHRLYQVQKLLMRNVGYNNNYYYAHIDARRNQETWSSKNNGFCIKQGSTINQSHNLQHKLPTLELDLERTITAQNLDLVAESTSGNQRATELIDESQIELTLGPAVYSNNATRQGMKKPETQLTSESCPSFSSSSTGSSQIKTSTRNASIEHFS